MKKKISFLQIFIHTIAWLPILIMAVLTLLHKLSVNPIQTWQQRTGQLAILFLVLSLACTPLRQIFDLKMLIKRRRTLGLYGFMYAGLHLFIYAVVDYRLQVKFLLESIKFRPFILLGIIAFLLLIPLAITSIKRIQKGMGKNWKRLHRLVYIISPIAVVHYLLAVKGNIFTFSGNILIPFGLLVIVAVLLLVRIPIIKDKIINIRQKSPTKNHSTD